MKEIRMCRVQWLVCSSGIIAALSLVSCALGPVGTGIVTPVSVAMLATDATAADALATIKAALTQKPTMSGAGDEQTQTAVAVAAATATQAALDATQTVAALPPPPTLLPTPNLAATAVQQATEQAAAVAATLTALAPSPTETPTATPNLAATDQEQATQQAAINATLTALAPTPDLDATRAEENHQMEIAVAETLTEVAAHFTPTPMPTNTPQPPTATPVPPPPTNTRVPPRPTNTPRPQPAGLFRGSVNPVCNGERNMTWFEGTVYVNGQPANGYKVAFKSYLVPGDQPATNPAISGPHDGYTDWANGYYAHIVNDHFEKKHLEVWIIDDAGQAISDRVRWNSDGTEGPCNKAVINFAQ